ncbi:hypothetical protein ElyMa_000974800 [Elysia marginata]|uniref:Uncharacterized protein n=1 Tax=Elysia marginata TaxID=1093978 RepID=A0AAV4HGV9_9GAST|nr:hypothetical protein ElyMa_000974800 [Elysia marginata]
MANVDLSWPVSAKLSSSLLGRVTVPVVLHDSRSRDSMCSRDLSFRMLKGCEYIHLCFHAHHLPLWP